MSVNSYHILFYWFCQGPWLESIIESAGVKIVKIGVFFLRSDTIGRASKKTPKLAILTWRKGQDVGTSLCSVRTLARIYLHHNKNKPHGVSFYCGGKDRIRTCGRFRLWFSRPVPSTTRPPFHPLL